MLSMNLKSWVESERGRAIALSKAIEVPPSFVSKMCSGEKPVPAEHCHTIEQFTAGVVTRQELRPRDWQKYWPELAQAHTSIAQAATENIAQA